MNVLPIVLKGHLTGPALERALETVTWSLEGKSDDCALVFDCLEMTGYDTEIRDIYITWHRRFKDRIKRVAVVTDRQLWRVVVSTVGLAVRGQVKTFNTLSPARSWAESSAS